MFSCAKLSSNGVRLTSIVFHMFSLSVQLELSSVEVQLEFSYAKLSSNGVRLTSIVFHRFCLSVQLGLSSVGVQLEFSCSSVYV